ncbi:hypothetical protein M407DRAFT_130967 [Tulasnella calospora MUT 4182]|uniref:Uncharacterized protein n=1 Tax=Tulasnella calospora MUT 4182 TaxID=1051891 RepID=A0A0C3QRS8_9AGAM|nr:hypothetical protein M407DRAFT_130967 [Tulasnella calospora MUT 4182]
MSNSSAPQYPHTVPTVVRSDRAPDSHPAPSFLGTSPNGRTMGDDPHLPDDSDGQEVHQTGRRVRGLMGIVKLLLRCWPLRIGRAGRDSAPPAQQGRRRPPEIRVRTNHTPATVARVDRETPLPQYTPPPPYTQRSPML